MMKPILPRLRKNTVVVRLRLWLTSGKETFRLGRFWAILAVLYAIVGDYKRTWFNVNFPDAGGERSGRARF